MFTKANVLYLCSVYMECPQEFPVQMKKKTNQPTKDHNVISELFFIVLWNWYTAYHFITGFNFTFAACIYTWFMFLCGVNIKVCASNGTFSTNTHSKKNEILLYYISHTSTHNSSSDAVRLFIFFLPFYFVCFYCAYIFWMKTKVSTTREKKEEEYSPHQKRFGERFSHHHHQILPTA